MGFIAQDAALLNRKVDIGVVPEVTRQQLAVRTEPFSDRVDVRRLHGFLPVLVRAEERRGLLDVLGADLALGDHLGGIGLHGGIQCIGCHTFPDSRCPGLVGGLLGITASTLWVLRPACFEFLRITARILSAPGRGVGGGYLLVLGYLVLVLG